MPLILVGKWALRWWVLRWWVRKLTHPTENSQVMWWVREAYPPNLEMAMGFMVGALRLPTLEWGAGFCRAGKRSAPALTSNLIPALTQTSPPAAKTHPPWVIALNTPATATAPGSSTPSRLSLPT